MTEHDDVRAQWLDHRQRTRTWNHERTDADRDRLIEHVTAQLRRHPNLTPQLRADLSTTTDDDYEDFLFAVLVPDRRLAITDPDAFRAHPEVAMTAEQMPIRLSAALVTVTTFPTVKDETALTNYTATWFGGRPLASAGDPWPRSSDGIPLTHVVQVGLDDRYEPVPAALGLPAHGLLQIFHDLHTYGEPEDAGSDAWRARWVDVDTLDDLTPLEQPDDLPTAGRIAPVPGRMSPMATVPPVLDFQEETEEELARYERVSTWLEQYPYSRNAFMAPELAGGASPWAAKPSLPEPVSRLCGYGYNEYNVDYAKILDAQLPLSSDDEHVMLADINPALFTDADWFHGQRHLQVWIRRSDLEARRFDDCWTFIRTDG